MIKWILSLLLVSFSCGAFAQQEQAKPNNYRQGVASFYHDKFVGRKTSTGEIFDNNKFTAASNTLKLGSYVKVTNLNNGKIIYLKINDRMAPSNKRVIDMASIAAKQLHFYKNGLTKVKVEVISKEEGLAGILAQREDMKGSSNQL